MSRGKRRKHLLGKFIFLIGAAYAFILAVAVIHSLGGLESVRESIEENMDPGKNLADMSSLYSESAVLLVLENGEDLDKQVRLSEDIFPELYEEGASMAGFLPGEHATVRDLLYGAMLPSGGECCKALAKEVAGSEEKFADLMNEEESFSFLIETERILLFLFTITRNTASEKM